MKLMITALLITLSCVPQPELWSAVFDFYGDFSGQGSYSSNVYKDINNYSDFGYNAALNLYLRSKFSRNTFCLLKYKGDIANYLLYNAEGNHSHAVEGALNQRLGDYVSLRVNANADFSGLFTAPELNSLNAGWSPLLVFYPFDHTEIEGGFIFGQTTYPSYDLDFYGAGPSLKIGQEFSLYTYAEIFGSVIEKNYSERYVYDTSSGTTPQNTQQLRKDYLITAGALLQHYFSNNIQAEISYLLDNFESNGNYYYWGPQQTEADNSISGDEQVIPDYYAYLAHVLSVKIKISLNMSSRFEGLFSYENKRFRSRLSRNADDEIKIPSETRIDQKIAIKLGHELELPVATGSFLKSQSIKTAYTYEQDETNDLPDKYVNHGISLTFCMYF